MLFGALVLKLGGAPFHFWFPQVINGLLWPQAIILMTIQKVGPLLLLCYLVYLGIRLFELCVVRILSAIAGALGGINQTSLRKIMAFSSINHIGWILAGISISELAIGIYFVFYCLIRLSIAFLFQLKQIFHFNHVLRFKMPIVMKILTFFSLLSLGGLPPFTGFVPKWILVQELASKRNFILLRILIASALVTLYFYMRVSLLSFTLSRPEPKVLGERKPLFKWLVPYLVFVNFFGLLIPLFI